MAEAKITIEKSLGIILTQSEIAYLKGLTQNYWGDGEEPYADIKMRESIWNAIVTLEKANG